VVIRSAAKQPIEGFACDVLFGPLSIADITWTKSPNSNTASLRQVAAMPGVSKSPQSMCAGVNPRLVPCQLRSRRKAAGSRVGVMQFTLDGALSVEIPPDRSTMLF
jgi:hypothetical protein